jgi:hypothetical protein
MRQIEGGGYMFESEDELELAHEWLWACLCDLSFEGMIETIIRIIFKRPPKYKEE